MRAKPGLLDGLVEDGRPLLMLTAVALLLSGGFAMFLAVRHLAPAFAGATLFAASALLEIAGARPVAATREAAA